MKTTAFTKTYNKRVVLSLPELEFEVGRITAIIGPNGSGKSTFAKILAGIERADDKREILTGVSVGYLPQKSFPFRMSTPIASPAPIAAAPLYSSPFSAQNSLSIFRRFRFCRLSYSPLFTTA